MTFKVHVERVGRGQAVDEIESSKAPWFIQQWLCVEGPDRETYMYPPQSVAFARVEPVEEPKIAVPDTWTGNGKG